MSDNKYEKIRYEEVRHFIKKSRSNGKTWEELKFLFGKDINDLNRKLAIRREEDSWEIDVNDWAEIYKLVRDYDEKSNYTIFEKQQVLEEEKAEYNSLPAIKGTTWRKYLENLEKNGFSFQSIEGIKDSVNYISSKIKKKTQNDSPIRGLVIGNVQSGKTSNMAGLIAKAADDGYNMFIILTGTIENLRKQTEERLFIDLNKARENLNFLPFYANHEKGSANYGQYENTRYLHVGLKNATRLQNLIKLINQDPHKKKQMRIIVIDDEADQAGINTANLDKDLQNKINMLITYLVFNKDKRYSKTSYESMNYIAYTATPFANILNDASRKSLYPHDFIISLPVSREYFGPQVIFGDENTEYEGLSIVNEIPLLEIDEIKDIHQFNSNGIPDSLKKSIAWFISCVAIFRLWEYSKPVSMLVHTSQRQEQHINLEKSINIWLNSMENSEDLISLCEKVYKEQTKDFSLNTFLIEYPNYGGKKPKNYPKFEELKKIITEIMKIGSTRINMDDEKDFIYNKGIHICIDNCKFNSINSENEYIRLAYPKEKDAINYTTAFLVIGGTTLSRGLTLEGLVSTYFLRSSTQADTLMQMGRWFGYRHGYELLPRLWLSEKAIKQFEFMSLLDTDIRKTFNTMQILDQKPSEYAPKIMNTPKYSFIRITSKNKMQRAEEVDLDFRGDQTQTTTFFNNYEMLNFNIKVTNKFVNETLINSKMIEKKSNKVFFNIDAYKVIEYIKSMKYPGNHLLFNALKNNSDEEIYKSMGLLNNWNVVLSGIQGKNTYDFGKIKISKINRSRRKNQDNSIIQIGVLRDSEDMIADVDLDNLSNQGVRDIFQTKDTKNYLYARSQCGFDKTPLLVIYIIDKDSKSRDGNRIDLNSQEDIVGVYISIPGDYNKANKGSRIRVKLEIEDMEADIE